MRSVTAVRRIGVSVVIALAFLVIQAAPASAHTVSGQGATNYKPVLLSISPDVPGLSIKTLDVGSWIQVGWTGSGTLTILGYENEPYLRIGPDGVYRNKLSPATYLNVTRTYYGTIPSYANAKAPPVWEKLSGGHSVIWHDHRIHWMGGPTPPEVRTDPGAPHVVFPWVINMTTGTTAIAVRGELQWVPGASPWPWVILIVLLGLAGIAAGRSRRWAPELLALLAVLIVTDAIHAIGTGLDVPGSAVHKTLLIFAGSYYSIVAWVLGAVAIRLLARRNVDGLFAAVFAALVIGLFGGLADIIALARSQVPFLFGMTFDRVLIAVSFGLGVGVVAGSVLAFRHNRPPMISAEDADEDAGYLVDPAVGTAGAGG
jgi:hypothetical protein